VQYVTYALIAVGLVVSWRIAIHFVNRVRVREAGRTGLSEEFEPEDHHH
jgi:hypothetical protein